ncbi:hypothetical protein Q8F55_001925 [Vanrija albida]|uniref:Uncharacterized protein n=1 Tax=Vanrija albida TaxID=181172 RepID=A0ABR3Q8L9_9TREE
MYYAGHTQSITPRFTGYDAGASYSQPLLSAPGNPAPQQQDVDRWYPQTVDHIRPPPTRPPPKSRKAQKKADGKQATFLTKLYAEDSNFHHIYGWMRKVSLRNFENGIVDPDASMWSHKTLRRDSPKDLITGFKRRVPPRTSQAQRHARIQHENQLLTSDSDSFNSLADPYPNHRVNDLDGRPMSTFALDNSNLVSSGTGQIGIHSQHAGADRDDPSPKPVSRPYTMSGAAPATAIPINRGPQLHLMVPGVRAMVQSAPASSTSFPGTVTSFSFPGASGDKLATDPLPKAALPNSMRLGGTWTGGEGRLDNTDPLLRGTTDDPTFRTDDASTWARRGHGTLGEGIRLNPVTPLYPSSLPSVLSFHPSYTQEPLREPLPVASSSFSDLGKALSPNPAQTSPPQTGAGTEPQAQTISPGVYRSGGFGGMAPPASQSTVTARSWPPRPGGTSSGSGSPQAPRSPTGIKHERRHSNSKGPYTPPGSSRDANTQPSTAGPGGAIRSSHIKRSSLSQVNTTLPLPRDEEALPSANLPGQPELFGGELDAKVEVVDG